MRALLATIFLLLPLMMGCATPSKADLDAEVKRLCAIDGGIRVYETIAMSPDKFNEWGQVNFFRASQGENALGPEYRFKWDQQYLYGREHTTRHSGEISMRRDHFQVMRKVDGKLLGELVTYHRAGGDLPGPWNPSSYRCPEADESRETELMRRIFTR